MDLPPPRAAKKPVTHSVHGHDRPDDYHWLRTQGRADPEVLAYLRAENAHLEALLSPHAGLRAAIAAELRSHLQEEDERPPVRQGEWLYFTRTEEGQPHPIFMRRPAGGGEAQTLLDLNALKAREGHANVWVYLARPSPDGRSFAFLLDTTGQEVWELRVLDTRTGELAEPPLTGLGGWTLAWTQDSRALYYSTDDATQRPDRIWRHLLGQPQAADELLWHEPDPTFMAGARVSEDGRTLLISSQANRAAEWAALDNGDPAARPQLLLPRARGTEVSLSDGGDHWLALTNHGGAEEFKLVRFPKQARPRGEGALTWDAAQDVWPHDPARHLEEVRLFARHLLVAGREGGFTRLWVLPREGGGYGQPRRVEFPDASYAVSIGDNREYDTATARITLSSLTRPLEHLDLDLDSLQTTLVKATPVPGYDPAPYVAEQVWATAPDGERIPVSLVRRRDTALPAPTLLYG